MYRRSSLKETPKKNLPIHHFPPVLPFYPSCGLGFLLLRGNLLGLSIDAMGRWVHVPLLLIFMRIRHARVQNLLNRHLQGGRKRPGP